MKEKIITQLKQEIALIESAASGTETDRHIYAAERLLNLLKGSPDSVSTARVPEKDISSNDQKMLELMGGKPQKKVQTETNSLGGERKTTDDGFGNGDSIFDF